MTNPASGVCTKAGADTAAAVLIIRHLDLVRHSSFIIRHLHRPDG
jgi:hypothetical protein